MESVRDEGLRDEIRREIAEVVGAGPDGIGNDASLTAGSWNSLQHLTILLRLSERYGFAVDPVLVQELTSVRAMAAHVAGLAGR
ncbi:acyl carrier protein [Streptomyces sp. NPDC046727]|uniref:acyl carrier protein n=1 Tax=Streptomyces sp. NPDC046727 TaxID=3155373 RepID=UPI0034021A77